MAGVEPSFEVLDGRDSLALIASANLERRSLKKGQRAMLLAMMYPDGVVGGRGKKGNPAETSGFSQRRLEQARSVLRHSSALAAEVVADRTPLDATLAAVPACSH